MSFDEKEFREKALLGILREGMNEPKNACFISESIKQNCVDSAKWGYYERDKELENLLANNQEFGLGLEAGAADKERTFVRLLEELIKNAESEMTMDSTDDSLNNGFRAGNLNALNQVKERLNGGVLK